MAMTFAIGQAAYVNKGAYDSSVTYAALNTCYYNGGTWVALDTVSNVTPGTDNTKWLCITQGLKSFVVAAGSTGYVNITVTLTDGTSSTVTVPVGGIGAGAVGTTELAAGAVTPTKTDFSSGLTIGDLTFGSSCYGASLPGTGVEGQIFFKKV